MQLKLKKEKKVTEAEKLVDKNKKKRHMPKIGR